MTDKNPDKKEQFLEYKEAVMDPISKSFCAAKWYNATIWLNHGATTSCHHPPRHPIPLEELKTNPSAIHNTSQKKAERKQMLEGGRPKGCEYCWVLEDMNKDAVSDRVFKTNIYTDEAINDCKKMGPDSDVNLKTLEVAFDRTCNFACAYCNPSFSTKWASDITKNGPYLGLKHLDGKTYRTDGSESIPSECESSEDNPYIKAFWTWWPELVKSLQEFRITGGEPLMSADCWKVLDYFKDNDSGDTVFALNSNLGCDVSLIDKLNEKSKHIKIFDLYTSMESTGPQAEFVRDGLDYDHFLSNLEKCITEGNYRSINVMMTISTLGLFSLVDFLDTMMKLKEKHGTHFPTWTVNLLRFPAFMSGVNLPDHLKKMVQARLLVWINNNKTSPLVLPHEVAGLQRLVDYLEVVDKPHRLATKGEVNAQDLKMFLRQYDKRRGKSFRDIYPKEFVDWIDSI